MLSAISNTNGSAFQSATDRSQLRSTRSETATAALAALSPVQPLPSVSDSFEEASDASSFLYNARGRPADGPQGGSGAGSAYPSARLGMESAQLTALLSSLMVSAGASPRQTVPVSQPPAEATTPATQETLVSRLYRQF